MNPANSVGGEQPKLNRFWSLTRKKQALPFLYESDTNFFEIYKQMKKKSSAWQSRKVMGWFCTMKNDVTNAWFSG